MTASERALEVAHAATLLAEELQRLGQPCLTEQERRLRRVDVYSRCLYLKSQCDELWKTVPE